MSGVLFVAAIPAVLSSFAWAFAWLCLVAQALDPHGFNPRAQGTTSWMEPLLPSFTTVSRTGVPCVALVVTRLVGIRGPRPVARAGADDGRPAP